MVRYAKCDFCHNMLQQEIHSRASARLATAPTCSSDLHVPAFGAGKRSRRSCMSIVSQAHPVAHRPFEVCYLRLATAVMSTENLAMKAEPHQLEPGAGNGLIGVVATPLAV